MEILKLLLEKVFSWPFVTLLGLLVFRKPLTDVVNRVHTLKAGKEGLTLDASVSAASIQAEAKVETGLRTGEAEQRYKEVINIAVSPVVQQREELIRADLQKMKLDTNQQESVDLLIRHLAITQIWYGAEYIYRLIFGSQIVLLKNLNTFGANTRGQLQAIYDATKSSNPHVYADYSFEQYLNFLISQRLIETNDQGGHYHITADGKEFLKWMMTAGVLENKPL